MQVNLNIYENEHYAKIREISPECMVLLKSNGDFPLEAPCKIGLFGSGARQTLKGGTGSGDVNSRTVSSVEDGLECAGFTLTSKDWLDAYDRERAIAHTRFINGIKEKAKQIGVPSLFIGMGKVMPEPEYDIEFNEIPDVCIYILSRISGEGSDRANVKGDFMLTDTEIRDILHLHSSAEKFMLVLNVGGMVDLSPILEVENILLLSQLGASIGDAFADVLLGKVSPSGKLSSSWISSEQLGLLGEFGDVNDTRYTEGIYVGYRLFDGHIAKPIFTFGFGLSYTSFDLSVIDTELDGERVEVTVRVKNTGYRSGKEVVQAYVSIPSVKIDQPYQTLAAFEKTDTLEAGDSCDVRLSFPLTSLVSFDEERGARVLEAGRYVIRVGSSSDNTADALYIDLADTVIVEKTEVSLGEVDFAEMHFDTAVSSYDNNVKTIKIDNNYLQKYIKNHIERATTDLDLVKDFSNEELALICTGAFEDTEGGVAIVGNTSYHIAGAAGETTSKIRDLPYLVMADGPAGVRISPEFIKNGEVLSSLGEGIPAAFKDFIDEALIKMMGINLEALSKREKPEGERFEQYCTAIPIGTALAQSFNMDMLRTVGDLVGKEMACCGVDLWLAPALNIHRNPLCGRNFEYFSEDPLLSGKAAAAITLGVQSNKGRGVVIKHFCANNQETNRYRTNSVLSERVLRDIYIRGFEICVKEASPVSVMTSYNLLNGVHTAESKELLGGVLRGEWGFDGLVMSDWITKLSRAPMKYEYTSSLGCISAGNDLLMPGSKNEFNDIINGINEKKITREELEVCAARVVEAILRLKDKNM